MEAKAILSTSKLSNGSSISTIRWEPSLDASPNEEVSTTIMEDSVSIAFSVNGEVVRTETRPLLKENV